MLIKQKQVKDNRVVVIKKEKSYSIIDYLCDSKTSLIHCLCVLEDIGINKFYISDKLINTLLEIEKLKNCLNKTKNVLNPKLNLYENIMLSMCINNEIELIEKKQLAIKLLNKIGLKSRIYHFPNELSNEEQQKVAIVMAFAKNSNIILAPKPTKILV